jgi:hypothetical protein
MFDSMRTLSLFYGHRESQQLSRGEEQTSESSVYYGND